MVYYIVTSKREMQMSVSLLEFNLKWESCMGTDGFEYLKKQDIKEQVFQQLLSKIQSGEWKPGEKLPSENELTRAMGVSRITVREAIQKLVAINLVETHQGKGSFVKNVNSNSYLKSMTPMLMMDNDDVRAVLEYRKIMEIGIIDAVIERATDTDIKVLERLTAKMKQHCNHWNINKYKQYDIEFHMKMYEITQNPFIIKISNITKDILNSALSFTVTKKGAEEGVDFHTQIIECIKARDARKLRRITRESLEAIEVETFGEDSVKNASPEE